MIASARTCAAGAVTPAKLEQLARLAEDLRTLEAADVPPPALLRRTPAARTAGGTASPSDSAYDTFKAAIDEQRLEDASRDLRHTFAIAVLAALLRDEGRTTPTGPAARRTGTRRTVRPAE